MVANHGDTWHATFPMEQSGAVRGHRERSAAWVTGHMRWLIPVLARVGKLLEAAIAVLPDQQMPIGMKRLWQRRRDEVGRWILIFVGNLLIGGLRADHLVFAQAVFGDRTRGVRAARLALCEEQAVTLHGVVRRVVKADFKRPRSHEKTAHVGRGLIDGVLRPASIHVVDRQNLGLLAGFSLDEESLPHGMDGEGSGGEGRG